MGSYTVRKDERFDRVSEINQLVFQKGKLKKKINDLVLIMIIPLLLLVGVVFVRFNTTLEINLANQICFYVLVIWPISFEFNILYKLFNVGMEIREIEGLINSEEIELKIFEKG